MPVAVDVGASMNVWCQSSSQSRLHRSLSQKAWWRGSSGSAAANSASLPT